MTPRVLSDLDALDVALGRLDDGLSRLQGRFRGVHEDVGAMGDLVVQVTESVTAIREHVEEHVTELAEMISVLTFKTGGQ